MDENAATRREEERERERESEKSVQRRIEMGVAHLITQPLSDLLPFYFTSAPNALVKCLLLKDTSRITTVHLSVGQKK